MVLKADFILEQPPPPPALHSRSPTNALDRGKPVAFTKSGNAFIYVHPKCLNDSSLGYTVETTTNLLDAGSWTSGGYTVSGTNVIDGTYGYVSNLINIVEDQKFIRIKVEQQ